MITIEAVGVTAVIIGLASGLLWLTARYEEHLGWFAQDRPRREPSLHLLRPATREENDEGTGSLTGTDGLRSVPVHSSPGLLPVRRARPVERSLGSLSLARWSPSDPNLQPDGAHEESEPASDGAHTSSNPESTSPE